MCPLGSPSLDDDGAESCSPILRVLSTPLDFLQKPNNNTRRASFVDPADQTQICIHPRIRRGARASSLPDGEALATRISKIEAGTRSYPMVSDHLGYILLEFEASVVREWYVEVREQEAPAILLME